MAKQGKNNEGSVEDVTFGQGKTPAKARWPFATLRKKQFFEIADLTKHVALRTAASRARKSLGRTFAVRKVKLEDGTDVIRVYRE